MKKASIRKGSIRFSDEKGFWNFIRWCVNNPGEITCTASPKILTVSVWEI